ncbi:hypothetical protein [Mucilaginibacter aquariorum]|uniref:Lipocalin-like domain-containing protein n=1 Tax=Mucilaginibacter aquariorum TaxID=2967225 RepID=A0ABT1T1Z8_9SPHI|nr:hypothetical protein [Mucilaginibacter aquariorum]MCQ6958636.1 hypothetical protein [Mucilaginibacter aquariorum]
MKKTLSFLLLIIVVLSACKKGGSTDPKDNKIKLEDLIGSYTFTEYVSENQGTILGVNTNSSKTPCMLNSIFTLNKDNTATSVYVGTEVCYLAYKSPSENTNIGPHEPERYIWKFVNNEVQLQLNNTALVHHYVVTRNDGLIQLTETSESPIRYMQVYTKK